MTKSVKPRIQTEVDRSPRKKKRQPIGRHRNILTVPNIPDNKVARWVADRHDGSRLQMFLDAGYEFVTTKGIMVGDRKTDANREVGDVVTINRGGEHLYLMVIDKDIYESDQLEKQKNVDAVDEAMRQKANEPGMYGSFTKTSITEKVSQ